ncbi:hypothetical protein CI102_11367 [Trichoderma harzianum]|nr:hypothetical protein CI102_11367 [Trichoderma harzianum]
MSSIQAISSFLVPVTSTGISPSRTLLSMLLRTEMYPVLTLSNVDKSEGAVRRTDLDLATSRHDTLSRAGASLRQLPLPACRMYVRIPLIGASCDAPHLHGNPLQAVFFPQQLQQHPPP